MGGKLLIFLDLSLGGPAKDMVVDYKRWVWYVWDTFTEALRKIASDFNVMNMEYHYNNSYHKKYFEKYKIKDVPTLVLLDVNDNEVDRSIGARDIYHYVADNVNKIGFK